MGTALNRNTMQIRESIPTSVYENDPDWLIIKSKTVNIELPDCNRKYWKIVDDKAEEMDKSEKQAVDDAEKSEKEKADAEAEREKIIQETIHKMGEEKAIEDGLIVQSEDKALE